MKLQGPKKILKGISYAYLVLAFLGILFRVIIAFIPQFVEKMNEIVGNEYTFVAFEISLGISIIFDLWNYWLTKRIVNNKRNGTFYMILLIIAITANIIAFITNPTQLFKSVDFVFDILSLICIIKLKSEITK